MPSYFQLAQPVRRPTRRTVRRRTAPPTAAEIICGALADRGIRADEFAERSALPKETAMAVLNGSVPVTRCIYRGIEPIFPNLQSYFLHVERTRWYYERFGTAPPDGLAGRFVLAVFGIFHQFHRRR